MNIFDKTWDALEDIPDSEEAISANEESRRRSIFDETWDALEDTPEPEGVTSTSEEPQRRSISDKTSDALGDIAVEDKPGVTYPEEPFVTVAHPSLREEEPEEKKITTPFEMRDELMRVGERWNQRYERFVASGNVKPETFFNSMSEDERIAFNFYRFEKEIAPVRTAIDVATSFVGGIAGAKAVSKLLNVVKSPFIRSALTRGITSGVLSGVKNLKDLASRAKDVKEYAADIVQAGIAGAFSAVPELAPGIKLGRLRIPWQAVQLIGQPSSDLLAEGIMDSVRGRDIDKDWVIEKLPQLAVSSAFALVDVVSGDQFVVDQKANIDDIKGWFKGRGGNTVELRPIGDVKEAVRPIEARSEETPDLTDVTQGVSEVRQESAVEPVEEPVVGVRPEVSEVVKPVGEPVAEAEPGSVEELRRQVFSEVEPIEEPVVSKMDIKARPGTVRQLRKEVLGEEGLIEESFGPMTKERSTPGTFAKHALEPGTARKYPVKPHEETIKEADRIIKERGHEGAMRWLEAEDRPSSEQTVVSMKLIKHYQDQASKFESEGKQEASNEAIDRSIEIANKISERLTAIGQAEEAVKVVSKLSPERVQMRVQKRLKEINKGRRKPLEIKKEDYKRFTNLAKDVQKWDVINDQTKSVSKIFDRLAGGKAISPDEYGEVQQYGRMLDDMVMKPKNKAGTKKAKKSIREITLSIAEKAEADAKARILAREKGVKLRAGIPVEEIRDYAIVGSAHIARGAVKFADFSEKMIKDFGEYVRPSLKRIYNDSMKLYQGNKSRAGKISSEAFRVKQIIDKFESGEGFDMAQASTIKSTIESLDKISGDQRSEAVMELNKALNLIKKPTISQKLSTAQTIAQLLNLKTIGRNIIANEFFQRVERLSKYPSTLVDIAVSMKTGERTITFKKAGQGGYFEGLIKGLRYGWKGYDIEGMQTKYDLKGPAFEGKGVFNKTMNILEKATGATLKGFDYAAANRAKNEFMGEMAEVEAINNKIPATERKAFVQDFIKNADSNLIEAANNYAKYMTFQDINFLSKAAVNLKKTLNLHKDFGVADMLLKYPKTLSNLIMRAVDFSPLGFLKSINEISKPLQNKVFDQREFSQSMGRAIIGSGLSGLGYMFLRNGVLTGSGEDYEIEDLKRHGTGEGKYKVNVSAIRRFISSGFDEKQLKKRAGDSFVSYDWAQPLAISLVIGADVAVALDEGENPSGAEVYQSFIDAVEGGANAFNEMPLLTVAKKLAKNISYDKNAVQVMGKIIEDVMVEIPSSFTPTFLYQIRQSMDNNIRETYDPNPFKRSLQKVMNKIPFVSTNLNKSYKLLGKDPKEMYQDGTNTLWNVFVNPTFVSKYKVDPLVQMALRPLEKEDRKRQIPRFAPRKIRFSSDDSLIKSFYNNSAGIIKNEELKRDAIKSLRQKMGIKKEKDRYTLELDAKKIQQLQREMGKRTEAGYMAKRMEVIGKSAEEQEKILARVVNAAAKESRDLLLKRWLNE